MRHLRDSISVKTPVGTKSPTQQHFKEQCTVSSIVKRFHATGIMPVNTRAPLYGDFSESTDLHTAMNLVHAAEADFGALSAHIRAAAYNDPREFLKMLATEDGCEKLQAAGLAINLPEPKAKPTPKDPDLVEGVPAPSTKSEKEKNPESDPGTGTS